MKILGELTVKIYRKHKSKPIFTLCKHNDIFLDFAGWIAQYIAELKSDYAGLKYVSVIDMTTLEDIYTEISEVKWGIDRDKGYAYVDIVAVDDSSRKYKAILEILHDANKAYVACSDIYFEKKPEDEVHFYWTLKIPV